MLEGIDVLNQYVETSGCTNYLLEIGAFLTIVFGLFALIVTMFYIFAHNDELTACMAIFWFCAVVGAVLVIIGGRSKSTDAVTETTYYQVTISDEVSMTEFYEKYDIVKQEGKIYTIKEKE